MKNKEAFGFFLFTLKFIFFYVPELIITAVLLVVFGGKWLKRHAYAVMITCCDNMLKFKYNNGEINRRIQYLRDVTIKELETL